MLPFLNRLLLLKKIFRHVYLFIFGCAGSSLLHGLFSSCSKQVLLSVVHGLLIAVTSLVEHQLWGGWPSVVAAHGLSSCGSWALEHRLGSCGVWA